MNTQNTLITVALSLWFSTQALAEISANAAIVNDYLVDGISQTDNAAAVQGGVDWSAESGFYLGAWGSMVDFNAESEYETDWYGGYRFGSGENTAFDVGIAYYRYLEDDLGKSSDGFDFREIYAGVTLYENSTLKYWRSNDYVGTGEPSSRAKLSHNIALNDDYSVMLEYTRAMYQGAIGENYNHYRVGVVRYWGIFSVDLSYHKTDANFDLWALRDDDAVSANGNWILTLSALFGDE